MIAQQQMDIRTSEWSAGTLSFVVFRLSGERYAIPID